MSAANSIRQLKEQLQLAWLARTEKERHYLTVALVVMVVAVMYSLFVGPALEGRAKLRTALPELRQQAAQMQALALEAGELTRQSPPPVTPMTRESLAASLTARGITPVSLSITSEYAKLQVSNVSFANLYAWLDAQRRENRIGVEESTITALPAAGQIDATFTLRQNTGEAGAGAR